MREFIGRYPVMLIITIIVIALDFYLINKFNDWKFLIIPAWLSIVLGVLGIILLTIEEIWKRKFLNKKELEEQFDEKY